MHKSAVIQYENIEDLLEERLAAGEYILEYFNKDNITLDYIAKIVLVLFTVYIWTEILSLLDINVIEQVIRFDESE